jgi:hypothetical protein
MREEMLVMRILCKDLTKTILTEEKLLVKIDWEYQQSPIKTVFWPWMSLLRCLNTPRNPTQTYSMQIA